MAETTRAPILIKTLMKIPLLTRCRVGNEWFFSGWFWGITATILVLAALAACVYGWKEVPVDPHGQLIPPPWCERARYPKGEPTSLYPIDALSAGVQNLTCGRAQLGRTEIFLYLFVILIFIRLWRISYLAYKPGAVEVLDFMNATGNQKVNSQGLTSLFIANLAQGYLPARNPVPADATPIELVHVAQKVNPAPKGFAEWFATMLLMLWPRLSYRISGKFVDREEPPNRGVLIHISGYGYTSRGGKTAACWSWSWEEAVEQAAHAASALILPYTRTVLDQPWQSWKGRSLSPELFGHYERANKLTSEHRYDEALNSYYLALNLDPQNTTIRIEIALLQERLGSFVDALDIYNNVLSVLRRQSSYAKRDYWVAWYRYVITLGFEEELVDQWDPKPSPSTAPYTVPERIETTRDRIQDQLAGNYGFSFRKKYFRKKYGLEKFSDSKKDPLDPGMNDERSTSLAKLFFLHACHIEARQLNKKQIWLWLAKRLSRSQLSLSAQAIRMLVPWVRVQLKKAEKDLQAAVPNSDVQKQSKRRFKVIDRFKIAVGNLRFMGAVKWRLLGIRGQSKGWLENYNAACTYAMALRNHDDDKAKEKFIKMAISHLQIAADAADSPLVVEHRDWLLAFDPDLVDLRREPAFRRFEAQQFPSESPIGQRPKCVHKLEVSRYKSELVAKSGGVMERRWHLRSKALKEEVDVHEQRGWWEEETEVWECLLDVCFNSDLWTSRVQLISVINDSKCSHGVQLRVSYKYSMKRLFEDSKLERPTEVENAFGRLGKNIKGAEPGTPHGDASRKHQDLNRRQVLHVLASWAGYFDDVDSGKRVLLARSELIEVAEHQAGLWQGLQEWFSSLGLKEEDTQRFEDFVQTLSSRLPKKQASMWYNQDGNLC